MVWNSLGPGGGVNIMHPPKIEKMGYIMILIHPGTVLLPTHPLLLTLSQIFKTTSEEENRPGASLLPSFPTLTSESRNKIISPVLPHLLMSKLGSLFISNHNLSFNHPFQTHTYTVVTYPIFIPT